MGLKPQLNIDSHALEYFMFETGSRGGVVVATTGTGGWPNGAARDDSSRRVHYAATSPGQKPVGILLDDVVNIDLSRQILNPYKNQVQVGSKVAIASRGQVLTNMIGPGQASGNIPVPTTGFLGPNGYVYTDGGYALSGWPVIGKVMTNVDGDGYATVYVDVLSQ